MRWYFELKGEETPRLSSKLVDCDSCRVHPPHYRMSEYSPKNKCCEFSPFISSFAAGALIEQGTDLRRIVEESGGELVPTQLGIVHNQSHRKKVRSLCRFYDSNSRGCQIWQQRPPTCYTFFCVTEKTKQWEPLENKWLEEETGWLKQWFQKLDLSEDVWAEWGLYMEADPLVELPEALKFEKWEIAESLYVESLNWLRDQC